MINPLLGPRELAQILGVKPGTVFSWISRGVKLPRSVKIQGTRRWREETVRRWIEQKEREKLRRNFED